MSTWLSLSNAETLMSVMLVNLWLLSGVWTAIVGATLSSTKPNTVELVLPAVSVTVTFNVTLLEEVWHVVVLNGYIVVELPL